VTEVHLALFHLKVNVMLCMLCAGQVEYHVDM